MPEMPHNHSVCLLSCAVDDHDCFSASVSWNLFPSVCLCDIMGLRASVIFLEQVECFLKEVP